MPFQFDPRINPEKPLDRTDLPPEGWQEVTDPRETKLLPGDTFSVFALCCEWEKRELRRRDRLEARRDKKKNKAA